MQAYFSSKRLSFPGLCAFLSAGYLALALLSLYATREFNTIAAVWPANGLLLAVLLVSERRQWTSLIAVCLPGLIAANVLFGDTWLVSVGLAAGNALEVSIAATLFSRCERSHEMLRDLSSILRFIGYCACLAPVFGAVVGAGTLYFAYGADFLVIMPIWWASDALGYLLIVPLVGAGVIPRDRLLEFFALVLFGALILVYGFTASILAALFPVLPLMMWAAFRIGPTGTATLGLFVSVLCISYTIHDRSVLAPFAGQETVQQVIFLQFYLLIAVFAPFVISVVWEERDRHIRDFKSNERKLQHMAQRADTLRAQAEQANRFKSLFLAQVSHEFRTPLNAIKGFSEMLQQEMHGPLGSEKNREYIDLIHWSGDHLLMVVNDLITYSHIESDRFEIYPKRFNPTDLIREVCQFLHTKIEAEGLTLTLDLRASDRCLYADDRALRICMINLIGNAIKFTGRGGKITVSVADIAEGYSITVTDNGDGIALNEQTRILEPFQRGRKDNQEGSGLGLAIVSGLMRLHGGELRLKSAPQKGTEFTLLFPRRFAQLDFARQ